MKKSISLVFITSLILLGLFLFNKYYTVTPRALENDNKNFSIAEFLSEPACYLKIFKSDVRGESGYLEDITFIQLTYIDLDNITGLYDYIPAEKDSKIGTIASYSIDPAYPDVESYTIKMFYEYDAEGERYIEEQFFMLINNEIRIASGEMKLDDDGKSYVYAEPKMIKWTDALPRVDCKIAREHDALIGDP